MRWTPTRIARRKLSTGPVSTATLTGSAFARPTRCGVLGPPGAAMATAGTTKAINRMGMEYVRFVSKRGTVAGFRAPQGDRAHTAHGVCADMHESRHEPAVPELGAERDPATPFALCGAMRSKRPTRVVDPAAPHRLNPNHPGNSRPPLTTRPLFARPGQPRPLLPLSGLLP